MNLIPADKDYNRLLALDCQLRLLTILIVSGHWHDMLSINTEQLKNTIPHEPDSC